MLGLSFTGRIHLKDIESNSSMAVECSSPPAISKSMQSIPRPSRSHSRTQSVRSTAPDWPEIMSPALLLVNSSIRITPKAYTSALKEGIGLAAVASSGARYPRAPRPLSCRYARHRATSTATFNLWWKDSGEYLRAGARANSSAVNVSDPSMKNSSPAKRSDVEQAAKPTCSITSVLDSVFPNNDREFDVSRRSSEKLNEVGACSELLRNLRNKLRFIKVEEAKYGICPSSSLTLRSSIASLGKVINVEDVSPESSLLLKSTIKQFPIEEGSEPDRKFDERFKALKIEMLHIPELREELLHIPPEPIRMQIKHSQLLQIPNSARKPAGEIVTGQVSEVLKPSERGEPQVTGQSEAVEAMAETEPEPESQTTP
nr:Os07g0145500 [Ipomoea batatas]